MCTSENGPSPHGNRMTMKIILTTEGTKTFGSDFVRGCEIRRKSSALHRRRTAECCGNYRRLIHSHTHIRKVSHCTDLLCALWDQFERWNLPLVQITTPAPWFLRYQQFPEPYAARRILVRRNSCAATSSGPRDPRTGPITRRQYADAKKRQQASQRRSQFQKINT
jgi:hypothetical protein